MEKNKTWKEGREHVFGDLQFSFKLAGCHIKNYNNNASSISPNREHFGYREDSGHWFQFEIDCSNLWNASYELSYLQSKHPTNKDFHHHNPTFKITEWKFIYKRALRSYKSIWTACELARMSPHVKVQV